MQGKDKKCDAKNSKDYNEKKKNKSIEETKYLESIPGYVKEINHIRKTEVWKDREEYNSKEKW